MLFLSIKARAEPYGTYNNYYYLTISRLFLTLPPLLRPPDVSTLATKYAWFMVYLQKPLILLRQMSVVSLICNCGFSPAYTFTNQYLKSWWTFHTSFPGFSLSTNQEGFHLPPLHSTEIKYELMSLILTNEHRQEPIGLLTRNKTIALILKFLQTSLLV